MHKPSKQKFIGAFLGTLVHYYDYSLYAYSVHSITQNFLPNGDYTLLKFYAIYATSYLAKPIGALLFGKIGDTYGRKTALNIAIIGIVLPTMLIGLLPTYSAIGIWSPYILALCRCAQGIFAAGEYDGAAIYVIEHMGDKYKATASALTRFTCAMGMLLAVMVIKLCKLPYFPAWGWRIPFFLSFPLALFTLYYRKKMGETPSFQRIKQDQRITHGLMDLLKKQWVTIIKVICLTGGSGISYQIIIVFMPQYLQEVLPCITNHTVWLLICFAVSMVISGILADKLGHATVCRMSTYGLILSSGWLGISIFYKTTHMALIASLLLAIFVAPSAALMHSIMVQAFPTNTRYRSISLGHNIGSMLMTSTANCICATMIKADYILFPLIYSSSFALLSYCIVSRLSLHYKP